MLSSWWHGKYWQTSLLPAGVQATIRVGMCVILGIHPPAACLLAEMSPCPSLRLLAHPLYAQHGSSGECTSPELHQSYPCTQVHTRDTALTHTYTHMGTHILTLQTLILKHADTHTSTCTCTHLLLMSSWLITSSRSLDSNVALLNCKEGGVLCLLERHIHEENTALSTIAWHKHHLSGEDLTEHTLHINTFS